LSDYSGLYNLPANHLPDARCWLVAFHDLFGLNGIADYRPSTEAEVSYPVAFGVLTSLKDVEAAPFQTRFSKAEAELNILPKVLVGRQVIQMGDASLQIAPGALEALSNPIANFDGLGTPDNGNTIHPPDTNGDIGYDSISGKRYYFQWVNIVYKVWDVTNPLAPVVVISTTPGNALWAAALPGSRCALDNDGDPIAMFDEQAQRWMISQFALNGLAGPFHQCIAVSQTADPTGAWNVYDYAYSSTLLNDYPHFGVWPDSTYNAYYMTVHDFLSPSFSYAGQAVVAFERAKMLTGDPSPAMVRFSLFGVNPNFGGMLPADLDGAAPANGTPGFFFEVDDDTAGMGPDAMRVWEFKPDWVTPASSTFGLGLQPNYTLTVSSFNLLPCTTSGLRTCVPQGGTGIKLDAIGDRLMFRVAFRNFGSHQAVVLNHTVWADGTDRSGVRWYEARRDPGSGSWSVYQEGTYAPADGLYRWMGSVAMDLVGNIALGYSASGTASVPSVRYVGRETADPLNTLPQAEITMTAGIGSQTSGFNRWGDYSMMGVDPQDGCTFWYTQEYHGPTASVDWRTRIGSFKFSGCVAGPSGTLTGTTRNADDNNPITGVNVTASSSPTQTNSTTSGAGGIYSLALAPGTYTLTASAFGYQPATISGVPVTVGVTTTQDILLTPVPVLVLAGVAVIGGDGDGILEPNETANIDVGLLNTGYATATAVSGVMTTANVHATIVNGNSAYADIAPADVVTNTTPFQVALDAGFVCGDPLTLTVTVSTAQGNFPVVVTVPTLPPPMVYNSTNVPLPIPDNPTISSTLIISDNFTINDVNVTINLTHTFDGDLDIFLVAPDGTTVVELTTDNGGSGDNYTNTTFDDEAATAITAGAAPFTGSYRPEGLLSTLDGLNASGTWTLRIDDDAGGDTGILLAWSLNFPASCNVPGPILVRNAQTFSDVGGDNNGVIFPGENNLTAQVGLNNTGALTATNVNGTLTALTPGVTVITDTASYGNIAPGGLVTNTQNFGFNVASTLACGSNLIFGFTADATEGTFDTGTFTFPTGIQEVSAYTNTTPLPLPDTDTVVSTISVPGSTRSVADVNVLINLTHTFDADMDIYLISPTGTRVELTTDNGGSGDNFINTIFDDEAATSITLGVAPFTGSFRPEGLLSAVDGQLVGGNWQLEITDDEAIDTGTLNNWSLNFITAKCADAPLFALTKSAGAASVQPGELLTFTLVAQNDGDIAASGVALSDTLPADVTYQSSSGGTFSGGVVTWTIGALPVGSPVTYTVTVQVNAGVSTGTLLTNTFTVLSNELPPQTSNAVIPQVYTVAVIDVTPTELTSAQGANTVLTQALTITNTGTGALNWNIVEGTLISDPGAVMSGSPFRLGRRDEPSATRPPRPHAPATDVIQDGSFEDGTPNAFWNEYSLNFGTPLCTATLCGGTGTGTGPRTGMYWAWFGGLAAYEEGSLDQDVVLTVGTATLTFYLEAIVCDSPADYLEVLIDSTQVYSVTGASALCGNLGHTLQTVDVSAFADGGTHNIMFYSETFANNGGVTNFFVDDVMLDNTAVFCTGDIPWLTLSPLTGTTSASGSSLVNAVFDSASLASGVYTGTVCILSNDPVNTQVQIPVTLTVVTTPTYGLQLAPASQGLTATAGSVVTYTLTVTNAGNVNDTFDVAVTGDTFTTTAPASVSLVPGASATFNVVVTAGASGSDTATITLTSQGDGTTSANATVTTIVAINKLFLPIIRR